MSVIIEAAEEGDDKKVRALIKSDPALIGFRTTSGSTPLHCAISQRQLKVVKTLVELGADVNAPDDQGDTPLHAAARSGALTMARFLFQQGADLHALNAQGQTPLQLAAGHVEVGRPETQRLVNFLLKSGSVYDIDTAVLQNDINRVRDLLGSGNAYWNQLPLRTQATLVHTSLLLPTPDILKLLLQHGADPQVRFKPIYEFAPIARATNPAMAELLLQSGADPSETDFQGLTLLDKARKFKLTELEAVLQKYSSREKRPD